MRPKWSLPSKLGAPHSNALLQRQHWQKQFCCRLIPHPPSPMCIHIHVTVFNFIWCNYEYITYYMLHVAVYTLTSNIHLFECTLTNVYKNALFKNPVTCILFHSLHIHTTTTTYIHVMYNSCNSFHWIHVLGYWSQSEPCELENDVPTWQARAITSNVKTWNYQNISFIILIYYCDNCFHL